MSDTVSSPTKAGDPVIDRIIRDQSDQMRRLSEEIKALKARIDTLERKI